MVVKVGRPMVPRWFSENRERGREFELRGKREISKKGEKAEERLRVLGKGHMARDKRRVLRCVGPTDQK